MDNKIESKNNLSGEYVGQYYDNFLSTLGTFHSDHRWFEGPVNLIHFNQTKKTLLTFFNTVSCEKVFEVGGGDGIWTLLYINVCENLYYLDISFQMLEQAKKRLAESISKISFNQGDFLNNTLEDNIFDTCISIRNFEYFVDKRKFLSEMHRILKEKGNLLLVTKSRDYNAHTNLKEKTLHSKQVSVREVITLLKESGFEILNVKPAIFGKLFRFRFARFISNILHQVLLLIPWKLLPLFLLGFVSESFQIHAQKKK